MPKSTWLLVVLSLLSGLTGAYVLDRFQGPEPSKSVEGPAVEPEQTELQSQMKGLAAEIKALREEVTALAMAPRMERSALPAAEPLADVTETAKSESETTAQAEQGQKEQALEMADWFKQMKSGDLSFEQASALWEKAVKEGRAEELLALFQERADADPNNPDRQAELGDAFIQHLQHLTGPKVAQAGMAADKAFNRALELDDSHLNARRSKAISLTFWPAIAGKRPEAIRQFETLIEKQMLVTPDASHTDAYLLLGNMHQQAGNLEKAREVWSQGLLRFPKAKGLAAQLANSGQ